MKKKLEIRIIEQNKQLEEIKNGIITITCYLIVSGAFCLFIAFVFWSAEFISNTYLQLINN